MMAMMINAMKISFTLKVLIITWFYLNKKIMMRAKPENVIMHVKIHYAHQAQH